MQRLRISSNSLTAAPSACIVRTLCPIISLAFQPNNCSAWTLQNSTVPSISTPRTAGSKVSASCWRRLSLHADRSFMWRRALVLTIDVLITIS